MHELRKAHLNFVLKKTSLYVLSTLKSNLCLSKKKNNKINDKITTLQKLRQKEPDRVEDPENSRVANKQWCIAIIKRFFYIWKRSDTATLPEAVHRLSSVYRGSTRAVYHFDGQYVTVSVRLRDNR